jgi:hypothetical protein
MGGPGVGPMMPGPMGPGPMGPGPATPPAAAPGTGTEPGKTIKVKPRYEFIIVFAWKEPTPSDKLRPIKIVEKKDTSSQGSYGGMGGGAPSGPMAPTAPAGKGSGESESDSSIRGLSKGGD